MNKILFGDTWFSLIASNSLYEVEFEEIISLHSESLFPDYTLVPFKHLVSSDGGSAMADFALIAKSYQEWWVVEVEMGHHSLESHVIPQIGVLARANYSTSATEYLSAKNPALDSELLTHMSKGKQPKVLVIAAGCESSWRVPIEKEDAALLEIDIFRSDLNKHLLHIQGDLPALEGSPMSACRLDPLLPRFLVIDSPSILGKSADPMIVVSYDGSAMQWKRIEVSNNVWITPSGKLDLRNVISFELIANGDGTFTLADKR